MSLNWDSLELFTFELGYFSTFHDCNTILTLIWIGGRTILFRPFSWQSNNRMAIEEHPHLPCGMLIATPWVAISIPQGK